MHKHLFLLVVLFFSLNKVYSQHYSDAGLWSTLTVQKTLSKRFTLGVDQEMRLKENFTRINLFYTNIGLGFKLSKSFKCELAYRHIDKMKLDYSVSYRHRLMLDITHRLKGNVLTFSQRIRFQTEVQDYLTSAKGKLNETFIRYKVELKANLDKFYSPYISSEIRYQVHSPRGKGPEFDFGFHRIRNIAGVDLKINKTNSLGLYYLIQSEFNISPPENIYIVGVQYILSL